MIIQLGMCTKDRYLTWYTLLDLHSTDKEQGLINEKDMMFTMLMMLLMFDDVGDVADVVNVSDVRKEGKSKKGL
ncbi:unnamed protein product [Camellia sinensis]